MPLSQENIFRCSSADRKTVSVCVCKGKGLRRHIKKGVCGYAMSHEAMEISSDTYLLRFYPCMQHKHDHYASRSSKIITTLSTTTHIYNCKGFLAQIEISAFPHASSITQYHIILVKEPIKGVKLFNENQYMSWTRSDIYRGRSLESSIASLAIFWPGKPNWLLLKNTIYRLLTDFHLVGYVYICIYIFSHVARPTWTQELKNNIISKFFVCHTWKKSLISPVGWRKDCEVRKLISMYVSHQDKRMLGIAFTNTLPNA